ncbi:hypothetical protein K1719_004891 [Acacia pycnantha]|nr:hypothetical protein K1719_004891 [Acacia pycnantha]
MIGSGMSKRLPYTNKDVDYDNAKFRHRSFIQAFTQSLATSNLKRDCTSCSTGNSYSYCCHHGVDGLGQLGATVVDALDSPR